MIRLSDQIHRAYRAALSSGSIGGAESLVVRLRDLNAPEQERDELWTQLIDHYIAGPRQAWAAALLEVMRVDLLAALGALPALPPAITRDDIAQQLATDVLATALEGPTNPARLTRDRLITRATTSVQRLLVDELRSATDESELPPRLDGSSQVSMQLRELMVGIEAGRTPRKAAAIIYREEVLGESLAELGADADLSPEAIRMQRDRGIAAIKSLLAAGGAAVLLTILLAVPAYAAGDINTVIDSVRNWVAGLLAALATLFLTIGGARYLTANGNPRAVEEGKAAIKSAMIGYALAALSPMLVSILQKVLAT